MSGVSAAAAAVALPVAAFVIWLLLRSPLARRLVAHPTGERWSEHGDPDLRRRRHLPGPRGRDRRRDRCRRRARPGELLGVLGGAALLFAVGLVDDVCTLPAALKLAAQFGAAAIALSAGLSVEIVSNDVARRIIGLLWLVGMTNAFNLLDNMDGLAGTLALIAAAFFAIDAVTVHEERLLLVLSLSLGLASLGFLLFNFRPGKPALVFMGDSGSQVLGFTLGALGLATSWKVAETTVATLMLPILVLAVPILDTALVTAVRMRERRPIHQGGRTTPRTGWSAAGCRSRRPSFCWRRSRPASARPRSPIPSSATTGSRWSASWSRLRCSSSSPASWSTSSAAAPPRPRLSRVAGCCERWCSTGGGCSRYCSTSC